MKLSHKKQQPFRQTMTIRYKKVLRIYEYDLENFSKIKVIDLIHKNFTQEQLGEIRENQWFGKTREKDGFYMIFKQSIKTDGQTAPEYEYMLFKGGVEYKL